MKYEFFINGYLGDLDIVEAIEKNLGEKIVVKVPQTPRELIKTISDYKCIVSARMHSCIVAYALGIPAVAFVWCEKLKFWGDTIGKSDCFLSMNELTPELAITRSSNAIISSYDINRRKILENTLMDSIKQAVSIIMDSK